MNIVVFGCDNSGKTTLCNDLSNYLNEDVDFTAESIHSLGPNKSVDEMLLFINTNMAPEGSTHTRIFDRFPIIEESIYGPILRGENKFSGIITKDIFDQVDLFVYCYPGLFSIVNWGEREQMDGVKDNVLDIINAYNQFAVMLKLKGYNVKEYNYKCDNYKELLNG